MIVRAKLVRNNQLSVILVITIRTDFIMISQILVIAKKDIQNPIYSLHVKFNKYANNALKDIILI